MACTEEEDAMALTRKEEERALNAARVYAASCGCSFSYDGAGQEGLFLKSCNPAADN